MDIALITVFIVSLCLVSLIGSSISASRLANIKQWVAVAVKATEMLYIAQGQGLLKKEAVFAFIKKKFALLKVDDINLLIEAAVFELNKK